MSENIINTEWPTELVDLEAAAEIMNEYIELNDGEPLGMLEVIVDKRREKPIEVRMPAWIQALVSYFRDQYGKEQGQSVASKVITRLLLKDETIH